MAKTGITLMRRRGKWSWLWKSKFSTLNILRIRELFLFHHMRITIRLNLNPANLEWKINAQTRLITYGSCWCRRLLRQIPWPDFKVNWTLLGLTHYTRLKTVISLIESYTQGWALLTLGSEAEVHQFGIEFVLHWSTRSEIFCKIPERLVALGREELK